MTLRAVDLFAGAGGASTGLSSCGIRVVAACELDATAAATCAAAHPETAVHVGDVRSYAPPAADLWWASPPCQAWSSAGSKRAARDTRNGWPWVFDAYDRTAPDARPAWIVAENVLGLTRHGRACPSVDACPGCYWERVVLPAFRERFPVVSWRVIDAADHGVPQRRRRVFVVAGPRPFAWPAPTHADPASLLAAPGLSPWVSMADALELDFHAYDCDMGWDCICHLSYERPFVLHHGRNTAANPRQERPRPVSEPAPTIGGKGNQFLDDADGHRIRRLTPEDCAWLQGWPDAGRYPFRGSGRQRYRQIGNAVPPPVAAAIGRAILDS